MTRRYDALTSLLRDLDLRYPAVNDDGDREVTDGVYVSWDRGDAGLYLLSIRSTKCGEGRGGRALADVLAYVDSAQVVVELDVEPFGRRRGRLSTRDLERFYARRGFIRACDWSPGFRHMLRFPRLYRPTASEATAMVGLDVEHLIGSGNPLTLMREAVLG